MRSLMGRITSFSQPNVLQARVREAGVRHGEKATVNLRCIAAFDLPRELYLGELSVHFCNMGLLEVIDRSGEPDDLEIPAVASIEGLKLSSDGFYDLLGFELSLNGSMALRATPESRVRRHLITVPGSQNVPVAR